MIRAAMLTLCAAPAFAADHTTWGGSQAYIREDDRCAYVVVILNSTWDDIGDYERSVDLGGLSVGLVASVGAGGKPDTVVALPPDGWLAIPPSVTVGEDRAAEILICSAEGVGA